MPESWHKRQAEKAAERKAAQEKGTYERKVRGKASEYREQGIKKDASFQKDKSRRVELDTFESVREAFTQLGKGRKCDVDVEGKVETVTVKGHGIYPMTRIAVTSSGKIVMVDTNNIKAGYFY